MIYHAGLNTADVCQLNFGDNVSSVLIGTITSAVWSTSVSTTSQSFLIRFSLLSFCAKFKYLVFKLPEPNLKTGWRVADLEILEWNSFYYTFRNIIQVDILHVHSSYVHNMACACWLIGNNHNV